MTTINNSNGLLLAIVSTCKRSVAVTCGLIRRFLSNKDIGTCIQTGAVIAGMVAALPFMAANYARASEGYISLGYGIDGVGSASFKLVHNAACLEGKDIYDGRFYPMFCPDCEVGTKAVSHMEGEEWYRDGRPENSETSATVYCSMISKEGGPIVVANAIECLDSIMVSGFEGYNVFIDGINARENTRIDFGTLTGSYGSGDTIRAVEISFQEIPQPTYAPDVRTLPVSASNIGENNATFEGIIDDDGGEACEYSFRYWLEGGQPVAADWECCVRTGETFDRDLSGLKANSTYYYLARGRNSNGEAEGIVQSFTTLALLGDFNRDNRINLVDFASFARDWKKMGNCASDIAGAGGERRQDGRVNGYDLRTFCEKMSGATYIGNQREDFETGFDRLGWRMYGDEPWSLTPDAHSGAYSAISGPIGNSGTSTLEVTLTCRTGSISFYRRVSSEGCCDKLRFYINGAEKAAWAGEKGWEQVSFPVSAGMNTFRWEYSKDSSVSEGTDAGYLDDIVFP